MVQRDRESKSWQTTEIPLILRNSTTHLTVLPTNMLEHLNHICNCTWIRQLGESCQCLGHVNKHRFLQTPYNNWTASMRNIIKNKSKFWNKVLTNCKTNSWKHWYYFYYMWLLCSVVRRRKTARILHFSPESPTKINLTWENPTYFPHSWGHSYNYWDTRSIAIVTLPSNNTLLDSKNPSQNFFRRGMSLPGPQLLNANTPFDKHLIFDMINLDKSTSINLTSQYTKYERVFKHTLHKHGAASERSCRTSAESGREHWTEHLHINSDKLTTNHGSTNKIVQDHNRIIISYRGTI